MKKKKCAGGECEDSDAQRSSYNKSTLHVTMETVNDTTTKEVPVYPELTVDMIQGMNVDALKSELKLRGLKVSGTKDQLLARY